MKYRSTADGKSLISQHQILQFIHLYNLIRIFLNTISIEYKTDYLLIQITENTPSISTMIQTNNFSFRLLTNEVIPTKLLSKRVIKINNLAQIYFLPQEQQNSMCLLNSINQE